MTNNARFIDLIEKVIDGPINNCGIYIGNFKVYSFPQLWGSTCLGFGGIGGQAFTLAQTTVIVLEKEKIIYGWVFFDDRPAYRIDNPNIKFFVDIQAQHMEAICGIDKYK